MSFILRLFGRKKESPEDIYLKGMDAFSSKNFQRALYHFDLAYKKSKIYSTKVNALMNSATINENRNDYKGASDFYYKAALLKASYKKSHAEIIDLLTKSYRQLVKAGKKNMGRVVAPLMLYSIAKQDFNLSQKGYNRIKDLKQDPLIALAIDAWELAKTRDTAIGESDKDNLLKIPSNFPKEMMYITEEAISVIRAYSVIEPVLELVDIDKVKSGEEITIKLNVESHANVEITKLILNVGNKGIITNFPKEKETFKLATGKKEEIIITLEAQLNGPWEIGPAEVTYASQKYEFTVSSNNLNVVVLEAAPSLDLEIEKETIEEDFEYEIFSRLINIGKVIIDNIQVKLIIPGEEIAKFTDGSSQKTIFSLNPGEKFEFSNKVKFEAGILGKEYPIKLHAKYQAGEASTELLLTSSPIITDD